MFVRVFEFFRDESLVLSQTSPNFAFYMLPTRVWQFTASGSTWLLARILAVPLTVTVTNVIGTTGAPLHVLAMLPSPRRQSLQASPPMATPNCPTCGRSNCSRQDRVDYDYSGLTAMRAAASLRR